MDFDRATLLLTLATGVVAILIQVWQRWDDYRQGKSQTRLDYLRHGLDRKQTEVNIEQQQADIHLRVTEGLRAELEALANRFSQERMVAQEYREKTTSTLDAMSSLFDDLEELFCGYSEENAREIIKRIRKFRRDYSL